MENVCRGQDYGFNHASTLLTVGFKDGEMYVYNEHYYKSLTNQEFITNVKLDKSIRHGDLIIGDSSEPARIKAWQQEGYNVRGARKGKDSLLMGIDYMKHQKIHIHKTRCSNTANEIQQLQYKKDKFGEVWTNTNLLNRMEKIGFKNRKYYDRVVKFTYSHAHVNAGSLDWHEVVKKLSKSQMSPNAIYSIVAQMLGHIVKALSVYYDNNFNFYNDIWSKIKVAPNIRK